MDFDYQLYILSDEFYNDYPYKLFPELLWNKNGRVYNCIIINSHCGYFICVPFRSNVNHKNAYFFKSSFRSKRSKSGLDYKKMVIVKDLKYLDTNKKAIVDQDEYVEMIKNIVRIIREAKTFLQDYIDYINGQKNISKEEFDRRYSESTLQYFHKELDLKPE